MRRVEPDSIEEQLQADELTEEDRDLLEHIFGDDSPPQGLHQQGHKVDVEMAEDTYA